MLRFYNPETTSEETDPTVKPSTNYIHLDTEALDRYYKEPEEANYNFGSQILGGIVKSAIDQSVVPIFYEYPSDFYSELKWDVEDEERELFSEDEYSDEQDLQNQVIDYRETFYKDALYGIAITGRPFHPDSNGVYTTVNTFEKYLLKRPFKTVFHYSETFATLECITNSFEIPTIGGVPMIIHERSWHARPATNEEIEECAYYIPFTNAEFIEVNGINYVPFSAKNWCRLLGSKFPAIQIPEAEDEKYILYISESESDRRDSPTQIGTIHVIDRNTGYTITQYHFYGQNAKYGWSIYGAEDRTPFELSAKTQKTYTNISSPNDEPNPLLRQVTSSTYQIKNGTLQEDAFEIEEELIEFEEVEGTEQLNRPIQRTGSIGYRIIKLEDQDI